MPSRTNPIVYTLLLCGLSALPPLSIDMNLPALPDMEASLGVAAGSGALTLSVFLLGFALAPIMGGPLADRFGRRSTVLVALAGTILGAAGSAASPTFWCLLLSRSVQGAACGVCITVPLAIVRDRFDGAQARQQLARIMAIVGLAPLLAPVIGGSVQEMFGWRAISGVQGLFGAFLMLLVLTGFSETLAPDKRLSLNPRKLLGVYARVLGNRTFVGFAFTHSFLFGCLFAFISGSPGLLMNQMGLSEIGFSLVFALISAGVLAGSFASGRLGRRNASPETIVPFCLSVMLAVSLGVLALAITEAMSPITITPLLFLLTFHFGLVAPNTMNSAVEVLPGIAGTASGTLNSLQMLMGATGSATVTLLSASHDPGRAMALTMAGSVILSVTAYLLIVRTRRRAGRAGPAAI